MKRVSALLWLPVIGGCCSAWSAGLASDAPHRHRQETEAWMGHKIRAERQARYCKSIKGASAHSTRWVQGDLVTPTDIPSRIVRRVGAQITDSRRFASSHEMIVVCVRPLVFVTYPDDAPSDWHTYGSSELRSSTVFRTSDPVSVWTDEAGASSTSAPRVLQIHSGESEDVRTDWHTLVFTRNADTYTVTTEGASVITPSPAHPPAR